jgi:hypothetical protein
MSQLQSKTPRRPGSGRQKINKYVWKSSSPYWKTGLEGWVQLPIVADTEPDGEQLGGSELSTEILWNGGDYKK